MTARARRNLLLAAVATCVAVAAGGWLYHKGREKLKDLLYQTALKACRQAFFVEAMDIELQMQWAACQETAAFVAQNMMKTQAFPNRFSLLSHSLKAIDPKLQKEGLHCEFGVGAGSSVNFIASQTSATIHGFDSWEGLPEDWRTGFEKGTFAMDGLPKVRPNVKLHKGWFNESLPVWAKEHPGPIAFIHFDADLYSSTKTVFDIIGDRIVPGTILQFDEYFNYPGWQDGEFKAFKEFVEARNVKFEYIGYTNKDEQAAVRILSIGAASTP